MVQKKKNKMPFIILTASFGIIIFITLFFTWGTSQDTTSATNMMGQSMGDMMGTMHLSDITVRDLITQQEQMEQVSVLSSQASHHSLESGFLKTAHYVTTLTIVFILPFILAGTIFLAIIWFNPSKASKSSEVKK